jgi:hypothetical protein
MPPADRILLLLFTVLGGPRSLVAQRPFNTDDTSITDSGKLHIEFFDEYDGVQLQDPNLRQNTSNLKVNYGLPHGLELDVDAPYISIYRSSGNKNAYGVCDTNSGVKWNFLVLSDKVFCSMSLPLSPAELNAKGGVIHARLVMTTALLASNS